MCRMLRAGWLAWLTLAAIASVGMAQVNSLNLLKKATNPPVAYQGKIVVTTWHSKASDAAMLREWRLPDGRYRVEYLAPRNLRGVVLLSDGKRRWRLVNNRPVWQLPLDDAPLLQVDLLARNYRLSAPAPATLLGRKAWRVDVTPKVAGKPHHRFWLDAEHGILLRMETFRPDGTPIAFMTVTELHFLNPSAISPSLFTVPKKAARRSPQVRPLSRPEAQKRWSLVLPATLPAGFAFSGAEEVTLPHYRRPFLHARYADGLVLVSLFVVSEEGEGAESEEPLLLSPTSTRLPVVRWKMRERVCYLIGGVSRPLLHRLAKALSQAKR
jgi:outer membrane lipoprotein-sorting protein